MQPSELLIKTRELLTPIGAWTQHTFARDGTGYSVPPTNENAVCWCITGAMHKIIYDNLANYGEYNRAASFILTVSVRGSIPYFNDDNNQTQENILNVLDKSIELAQSQGF